MSANSRTRRRHRALTLLETMVSMVIVSVMMLAALSTIEATSRMRRIERDRPRAALLAHDLMAEILITPSYEEPFEVVDFGPEGVEPASGRAMFDDIDDYHGWTCSPPQAKDGSTLPGLDGWSRSVTVAFGDPADLESALGSDLGVKTVTVTVSRDGKELASLTTVRTDAWRSFPE